MCLFYIVFNENKKIPDNSIKISYYNNTIIIHKDKNVGNVYEI